MSKDAQRPLWEQTKSQDGDEELQVSGNERIEEQGNEKDEMEGAKEYVMVGTGSSSGASSCIGELSDDDDVDDDVELQAALVSVAEQRRIVAEMSAAFGEQKHEGCVVNIVSKQWIDLFRSGEFRDAQDARDILGPLTTEGILGEYGGFCDTTHFPLEAVECAVFEKLVEWYGIRENNVPVSTYLVVNSEGELVPEFTKPLFYLHHLSVDASGTSRFASSSSGGGSGYHHYGSAYSSAPMFTLSCLHTLHELVQFSIVQLDEKEALKKKKSAASFTNSKFRVWVVDDEKVLNLNYQINPATFMALNSKTLIKKAYHGTRIKNSGLTINHLVIEEKIKTNEESYWPSEYFLHYPPTPSNGQIGLQNLGNTCYMNSALQCLVHIPELTSYFLYNCYESELNPDNPLGMSGKVATSFAQLIHSLFDKRSTHNLSCIPRDFKQTIGHFNSMFSGYHQQDSQEFLAFLLDGLHEDLNRIIKKPFTETPELDEKDATNLEAIKELAEKSWHQHKLRNDSIITDLFVGLYKSTLICPVCNKISITFDPFNDLTLPLPVENVWSGKIILFLDDGPLRSFEVELSKTSTYQSLKSYVAEKLNLDARHLITAEIWNHQFYRNFESASSQSSYLPLSDLISDGDIIVMYEVKPEEGDDVIPVLNTVNPPSNIPDAFGIPFFITLKMSEKKSFGAIRRKLEHRYEQLSTFQYFSKVRQNQQDREFTIKDFPLLHNGTIDEGYESDISLANPEISGDYAFKVKLFNSSHEVRPTRKNYTVNRYRSSSRYSNNTSPVDDKIWTPTTSNNFRNLPNLLDSINENKRAYYTYGKKLDIDSSNESSEITPAAAATTEDIDQDFRSADDVVMDDESVLINEVEEAASAIPDANEVTSLASTEPNFESNTNSVSSMDEENNEESNEPSTTDMDLEPLSGPLSFPSIIGPETESSSNGVPDSSSGAISVDGDVQTATISSLLPPHTALICEWSPDLFDTFFSGLEDEGEGGKETWTNPEPLVNEEVEESKRMREEKKNDVLSLDQCLKLFSKPEVLGDNDLWYCSTCKEHRQASKQIQIWNTPDILSIHLKRFENQRSFSDKISAVVDFPIEGLDMAPYLADTVEGNGGHIYDLFAVDNHYGGLGGGHYTSYVKNFVDNQWYYYDDSRVTPTNPEKAVSGAAYLLFYRKRSSKILGGDHFISMIEKARSEKEAFERKELETLEQFYEANKDETDEEEEDEDDEEDDDGGEVEEMIKEESKDEESIIRHSESNDDSSDNVSSIPVGTDDEDDLSSSRRKQRLLSRGRSSKHVDIPLQSDVGSPALDSPSSINSDDNCSTYSSSVTVPSNLKSS